ncbi:hypothetical protein GCM10020000_21740 [Streptomyces olivoverticillatus]
MPAAGVASSGAEEQVAVLSAPAAEAGAAVPAAPEPLGAPQGAGAQEEPDAQAHEPASLPPAPGGYGYPAPQGTFGPPAAEGGYGYPGPEAPAPAATTADAPTPQGSYGYPATPTAPAPQEGQGSSTPEAAAAQGGYGYPTPAAQPGYGYPVAPRQRTGAAARVRVPVPRSRCRGPEHTCNARTGSRCAGRVRLRTPRGWRGHQRTRRTGPGRQRPLPHQAPTVPLFP